MAHDHDIPTAKADLNLEPSERLVRPFTRFASLASSGGIVLLLMTAIAMVWANIDYDSYKEIFNDTEIRITVADNPHDYGSSHDDDAHHDSSHADDVHSDDAPDSALASEPASVEDSAEDVIDHAQDHIDDHADDHADAKADKKAWHVLPEEPHWWQGLSMVHWINDLLMAVFFLVVGLEIKREILVGELASPKRAMLPIFGALGGMVGPALLFVLFNYGKETIGGWGIPMATDIAFAVGILAMMGKRIPNSLKVFLVSLAIVDDLGALIVIAVFYTDSLATNYLGYAGAVIALLIVLNILRVRWITLYLLLGLPLWYFVYKSGVHATIAGVMLALTIPAHARVDAVRFLKSSRKALDVFENAHDDPEHDVKRSSIRRASVNTLISNSRQVLTPLHRIEHVLHPWVAFMIIPVFALANAGIPVHGGVHENLSDPAAIGIIVGLFVGKPLGIILFCWIAVTLGIASVPRGVSWRHLLGAAWLGGIGFTMAIFIANLAFADNTSHLEHAKLAILLASALSAIAGAIVLMMCKPKQEPEPERLGPLVDEA